MPEPPQVIHFADCVDRPWANGGGSTRVIAVGPENHNGASFDWRLFDWRLSVASVTSGDFSVFPGVDRVIVLADGPTMTLTIDGADHPLDPFCPRRFAGESAVRCVTGQPCLDFNVMTRRDLCSAEVDIRGPGHVDAPINCLTFVVVLAGASTLRFAGGHIANLERFDSVLLASAAELRVEPSGRAAVVRVKYAAGRTPA